MLFDLLLLLSPAAQEAPSAQNEAGLALFRERVRPILQNNCLECHNASKSKGDFDLSTREALLFEGEFGAWVVPGDPDFSDLLLLVDHADKPHMPKDAAQLPAEDREALRRWIELGAPYDGPLSEQDGMQITEEDRAHWAFTPLAEDDGTPIDAHLDAQRSAAGLQRAPQAGPRQLLRRLTLDLTGLPPTPAEMEAFLLAWDADEEAAWAETVDRLLASPRYGERWGRHWLDAARYADSGGYEFDVERPNAWPYRDWVIEAYNGDLPYDEFLRLQLAGDEIRPGDPDAHAATGFLTAGPRVTNQRNEQLRYDELDDMVATMGSAMMGLTIACARCHDHKFDPIPTRDYYALVGAFIGTETTQQPLLPPNELAEYRAAQDAYLQRVRAAKDAVEEWQEDARARIVERRLGKLELTEEQAHLLLQDEDPDLPVWRYTLRDPGQGWQTADFDDGDWPTGPGGFGTPETPGARVGTPWKSEQIWLRRQVRLDQLHRSDFGLAIHHDEDVRVYVDGELVHRAEGYTTDYEFVPLRLDAVGTHTLAVHCKQTRGGQYIDVRFVERAGVAPGESLGDFVFRTPWSTLREQYGEVLVVDSRQLKEESTEEDWQRGVELRRALSAVQDEAPEAPQTVLSIRDSGPQPEPNWLLGRGNPADKRKLQPFGFLEVLGPPDPAEAGFPVAPVLEADSTGQRRALAQWMTDPERGAGRLVARVEANRVWQHHFGRGIVATPGDFGTMAEPPTHPELLDALATRLIASGWSRKALHREILMSEAYRQAGRKTAELAQIDGNNQLWSYRPPVRLEAEAIRDAMLAVSGSLNLAMGGPGVQPWIHRDVIATGSTVKWPQDVVDGPDTWRRTVYVFQRRSVLMPTLETFDLPAATQSCTRRNRTTTPTQALALLNNAFVRDQAKRFAARVVAEAGDDADAQIDRAFALALGRPPEPRERAAAAHFLAEEDLADFCQVLFLLNEFLYLP